MCINDGPGINQNTHRLKKSRIINGCFGKSSLTI